MKKIFGLFVTLGVLGDLAVCLKINYPLPYTTQYENFNGRRFSYKSLFDYLFSDEDPNEAGNITSTTTTSRTPSTTPIVVPKPTTKTAIVYPMYQEPNYDPNHDQIIPPYPISYNASADPLQLKLNNFGFYYPVVDNISSIYSDVMQPVPNKVPNEARNTTSTTTTSTTPSTTPIVVPKPTTETAIVHPVYQEPNYDPNHYQIIPPYPIFYNAPVDPSQLQLDNFAPYYPVVDNIPSIYSDVMQPVPYFNPGLIHDRTDEIILQPKNDVQETMNKVAEKLLYEFYAKHLSKIKGLESIESSTKTKGLESTESSTKTKGLESTESSTKTNNEITNDDELDQYRILIEPRITAVPETSTYPVVNRTPSMTEKLIDALKPNVTNKPDSSTHVIKEIEDYVVDDARYESVSNSTFRPEVIETTLRYIEVNQTSTETASRNETKELRKLDINIEGGELTTDTTTDESSPISVEDFIKRLINNRTSADFKLHRRIEGETTSSNVKTRRFYTDPNGNKCMQEIIVHEGKKFSVLSCDERSYNGGKKLEKKSADQSDVAYFTEELQTQSATTELAPQHLVTNADFSETYDK